MMGSFGMNVGLLGLLAIAQQTAQDLPRWRLGNRVDELQLADLFEMSDLAGDEIHLRLRCHNSGVRAGFQHHEALGSRRGSLLVITLLIIGLLLLGV